jgi:hypothetical protein
MTDVIQAVLTILVGAAIEWVFKFLKVEIDEKTLRAIVASIVAFLLGLAGVQFAQSQGLL